MLPTYRDLRDGASASVDLASYRITAAALSGESGAHRLWGYLATTNYFELLGIRPAVGRFFTGHDSGGPGAAPYIVLSYDFWRSAFAADPRIAGRTIRLNEHAYTVIGVAPEGFYGTEVFLRPQFWVPMAMQPQIEGVNWLNDRFSSNTMVIARLRDGVSAAAAAEQLSRIQRGLTREYRIVDGATSIRLSRPGLMGDVLRSPAVAFIGGVMVLAVLVLLTACVNLGSILAARLIERSRELGIRLTLGASRLRLVRHVAVETVMLTTAGGALGLLFALAVLAAIGRWEDRFGLPIAFDVRPDPSVFAFVLFVSLAAGTLVSLAMLRRIWRFAPSSAVSPTAPVSHAGRRWTRRDVLLSGQVALCALLLTASVVALRGLGTALTMPTGVVLDGATVVTADLAMAGYDGDRSLDFDRRLLRLARAIPGVTHAAIGSSLPLTTPWSTRRVFPDGVVSPGQSVQAQIYQVTPGFFAAVGTRMFAGRDFREADDASTRQLAIVNETFARQVMGTDPAMAIGKQFREGRRPVDVVGVVESGKYQTLSEAPRPAYFRLRTQDRTSSIALVLRSTVAPATVAADARQLIGRLDPRVPLMGEGTYRQAAAITFIPSQVAAASLGTFGLLAILLAMVGVYGTAAYSVSSRWREIGIRIAVGARSNDVLRTVLGRTAIAVIAGGTVGVTGGVLASDLLAKVVYQASARDPIIVGISGIMLMLVGVAATYLPARRALAIEPAQVLRAE